MTAKILDQYSVTAPTLLKKYIQSLKFQTWKFVIRQINVVQQTEQESLSMYPIRT